MEMEYIRILIHGVGMGHDQREYTLDCGPKWYTHTRKHTHPQTHVGNVCSTKQTVFTTERITYTNDGCGYVLRSYNYTYVFAKYGWINCDGSGTNEVNWTRRRWGAWLYVLYDTYNVLYNCTHCAGAVSGWWTAWRRTPEKFVLKCGILTYFISVVL